MDGVLIVIAARWSASPRVDSAPSLVARHMSNAWVERCVDGS